MRSTWFLAVILLVVTSLAVVSASHGWSNYHWQRTESGQVSLDVSHAFEGGGGVSWSTILANRLADWHAGTNNGGAFAFAFNQLGDIGGDPKKCKAIDGELVVCAANYGGRYVGVTQVWVSGGHIEKSTVKMNNFFMGDSSSYPVYQDPAYRRMVMCHELGHAWGLGHRDEDFNNWNLGTCMDYTLDVHGDGLNEPSNETFDPHDTDQVWTQHHAGNDNNEIVSGNEDPPDEGGSGGPPGGGGPPGQNRVQGPVDPDADWGQLVSSSPDGYGQVFERNLGANRRLLTFVIWPHPTARR